MSSDTRIEHDGSVAGFSNGKGQKGCLPAVLVHGFSANAGVWQDVMIAQRGEREVIAMNMPGHGVGHAIREVKDGSVEEMVNFTHDSLDGHFHSSDKRFHLVGTSWGGAIAADYARAYPEEVVSLTLVAPCGLCSPVTRSIIKAGLGTPSRKAVRARMRLVFADSKHITETKIDEVMQNLGQKDVQKALKIIFPQLLSLPLSTLPAAIAARTWLAWGQKDKVVKCPSPEVARQLASEVTLYPDIGHIPQVEREQDFKWRLSSFWRRYDGAAA